MEEELDKLKGRSAQTDETKAEIKQMEAKMQKEMKRTGLTHKTISQTKAKLKAQGKPLKRSKVTALKKGAAKASKKSAANAGGVYKIVTFAKAMADPNCGSPFDAFGTVSGGGFSLSVYFDIGPVEYNSVTLVQTFTAGGGIDFVIPIPIPGVAEALWPSLVGGGSLYITFGSKVTVVPEYKFQRTWALYKLTLYGGLQIDLVEKLYQKIGKAKADKLKKWVDLTAAICTFHPLRGRFFVQPKVKTSFHVAVLRLQTELHVDVCL